MGVLETGKMKSNAFNYFWNLLEKNDRIYTRKNLKEILYQGVRNSIAHSFLICNRVGVHLKMNEKHLDIIRIRGQEYILVSCQKLFDDFVKVYNEIKYKRLSDNSFPPGYEILVSKNNNKDYLVMEYIKSYRESMSKDKPYEIEYKSSAYVNNDNNPNLAGPSGCSMKICEKNNC